MDTITIKDIAKLCGVGVSTVSRAINNHPDISAETKAMVMNVIEQNHYVPNNSARNLKRSDSKTIAVLIKGIGNIFFNNMIKIFEEETQLKKYAFILHRVKEKENEIDVAIQLTKEKKLKGIIFLGGYFCHSEEKLSQLTIPFVISTIFPSIGTPSTFYSSVAVDDFKESYKLVDYLCKLGHKKIAIIKASPDDESIGKLRFDGYKKALLDNNIRVDESLIYSMKDDIETYSMQNGYEVTKDLLSSNNEFTALYAISDTLAIGACKALFEANKKIPEDCSVAGFDGIDMAYYYNPSITTIKQPVEEMATETISILFDMIKKKSLYKHKIFPAQLVEGQSTKAIL